MTSPETFGLALRRARQHRRISLTDIAAQTNVKVDLWEDMERNDFARWPQGVYARTWVRAYAQIIGVDPQRTVDDFCRWFPQGDRRVATTLQKQAEIIGHDLAWEDDLVPEQGDRRAEPIATPKNARGIDTLDIRLIASACDLCVVTGLVMATTAVLDTDQWATLGAVAPLYYAVSLAWMGCTPAVWAIDGYARRDPGFYRRGTSPPFRRLRPGDVSSRVANAGH